MRHGWRLEAIGKLRILKMRRMKCQEWRNDVNNYPREENPADKQPTPKLLAEDINWSIFFLTAKDKQQGFESRNFQKAPWQIQKTAKKALNTPLFHEWSVWKLETTRKKSHLVAVFSHHPTATKICSSKFFSSSSPNLQRQRYPKKIFQKHRCKSYLKMFFCPKPGSPYIMEDHKMLKAKPVFLSNH